MSILEIKDFCERIVQYGLYVKVRLKKETQVMEGKITEVTPRTFLLQLDGKEVNVQYAHVASIKHR